jgi:hypothetical protein
LGGVDTGSMNAMLEARAMAMAGGTGLTPAACAVAIASGASIVAVAVFDVVSVSRMAANEKRKVRPTSE